MGIMYYTRLQRFWFFVYWLFLMVSFCLIGFWLVATAQGYRYNVEVGRWQKTGMIIASSNPRDATLDLGRQSYDLANTNRVANLLPGTYRVKISKAGYLPWEKTIQVEPGFVVSLDEVTLFFDQPIALTNSSDYEALLPFYNVPDNRLSVIDGELRRGTSLISRFVDPPTAVRLLSSDRHVVYLRDNQLRLIESDGSHDQLLYQGQALDPALLVLFENSLVGLRDQGELKVFQIR